MNTPAILRAAVPRPIQVVIDDVGWWSGEDAHWRQEPYRTGIDRHHVPEDYRAIAWLGRALNMRPQAAFVLAEWDRDNILRDLPSSTWMGESWENAWNGPWLEQAADILHQAWDYIEPALHGIAHEFWVEGRMERAEWHDARGKMRPAGEVLRHLEYFHRLQQQHYLGPFPESFVPAAFLHRFGDGDQGIPALLKPFGVHFLSTPFERMTRSKTPVHRYFDFDGDIMTVDRGQDICAWNALAPEPKGELSGPICGMHWPNLLHADPTRNREVVERWAAFLRPYGERLDTMLARDTRAFSTQLIYHECVRLAVCGDLLHLHLADANAVRPARLDDFFAVRIETRFPARFRVVGASLLAANPLAVPQCLRYEISLGDCARAETVQVFVEPLSPGTGIQ